MIVFYYEKDWSLWAWRACTVYTRCFIAVMYFFFFLFRKKLFESSWTKSTYRLIYYLSPISWPRRRYYRCLFAPRTTCSHLCVILSPNPSVIPFISVYNLKTRSCALWTVTWSFLFFVSKTYSRVHNIRLESNEDNNAAAYSFRELSSSRTSSFGFRLNFTRFEIRRTPDRPAEWKTQKRTISEFVLFATFPAATQILPPSGIALSVRVFRIDRVRSHAHADRKLYDV